MPHPTRTLNDLKKIEWVAGNVAAALLHCSHQYIISLAVGNKVERKLTRVTHCQVRPRYVYRVADLKSVALTRKLHKRAWHIDETRYWLTAASAAHLLVCSVQTIKAYADSGEIMTRPHIQFVNPVRRVATGYSLRDIMAIVVRREAASDPVAFHEETVLKNKVVRRVSTFIREAA